MRGPTGAGGLLLAGGTSRRFGEDKARHRIDGTPMIARVYRALRAVTDPVVISVRDARTSYADVLPRAPLHVPDGLEDAGPLAGIRAGFAALETEWVFVAACDMPDLTQDVIRRLLSDRRSGVEGIVGTSPDGRLHPLCACYRRPAVLTAVRELLKEGRRGVHRLLDAITVERVGLPAAPLRNVNDPGDL